MNNTLPETVQRSRNLPSALIPLFEREPWRFGFLAIMRRINANATVDQVGTALLPGAEPFRIGQKPSLIFAPSEIAEAKLKDDTLHIRLFGLGMLGPNGSLPIQVTEIAREREEQRHDPTLCNFLDVFHHRSLALLYRAWARSQAAASLDRPEHDRFSLYVSTLTAYPRRRDRPWPLASHARLAATPYLARMPRTTEGLRNMLSMYFAVPVQINENVLHWMTVGAEEQCYLGEQRMSSYMAMGAMLGEQTPDRMYRFSIVFGPLDMVDYHRFTPQGSHLLRLIECVRAFIRREYTWELVLRIKPDSATPTVMGGPQQLGWSSWLGESPTKKAVEGMRFEPETYLPQLRSDATRHARECAQ